MKKLFAALLALGLIVAVSGTASAVDVKFGGSYYVVGVYDDNPSLQDSDTGYSRAYFYQRIRLQPVFKIAEGLTFTARMDAMEGNWDIDRSKLDSGGGNTGFDWERGYVTFNTGIGVFDVGYQAAAVWGTTFADNETTRPRIKLTTKLGPMTLLAIYEKRTENGIKTTRTDADYDFYYLAGIYPFKGGSVGLLSGYGANNTGRPTGGGQKLYLLEPMMKATFGPVYVEAEVDYFFGKAFDSEIPGVADKDFDSWAAYIMAKMNFGPATIGAQVGWAMGDDDAADDKVHNAIGGGVDWNPALILMNDDLATWSGYGATNYNTANSGKNNFLMFNIFGDYKVTPKFSLGAALTYAKADETPAGWDSDYGTEFDVTATYKLYDNLTYMVGAGYLFTGDYYKGLNGTGKVDDDYILMNKLTLSF